MIELKGSHFDINYQISEHFKYRIQKYKFKSLEEEKVNKILDKLKPYPTIVEEIEGRAKGWNISIAEYLYLTSYELEDCDRCSDIFVCGQNEKCIWHNEDGEEKLQFFLCDYGDEKIFDLSGYETLHGTTFSATKNIMLSVNYIFNDNYNFDNDLPTWIFPRLLLCCKNFRDFKAVLKKFSIWGSISINLLDVKKNRLYSIEKYSDKVDIKKIKKNYYHTNHFIHSKMKKYDRLPKELETTMTRYNKISQLLEEGKLTLKEIMLYNNGNDYESVRVTGKNVYKSCTQATIRYSKDKIDIIEDGKEYSLSVDILQ